MMVEGSLETKVPTIWTDEKLCRSFGGTSPVCSMCLLVENYSKTVGNSFKSTPSCNTHGWVNSANVRGFWGSKEFSMVAEPEDPAKSVKAQKFPSLFPWPTVWTSVQRFLSASGESRASLRDSTG